MKARPWHRVRQFGGALWPRVSGEDRALAYACLTPDLQHVFESIAQHGHFGLHVRVLSGRDPHHIVEAQFKAFARALRDAVAIDPRETGVPSTKGSL